MLNISDLKTEINNTKILNGINLSVKPGEVHAIMGPNGSEKVLLLQYWLEKKSTRLLVEVYSF